jgi:hypothetical protein
MAEPDNGISAAGTARSAAPAAPAAIVPGGSATTDRPDPGFEVNAVESLPRSAVPALRFSLEVSEPSGIPIHFIALTILITIEPGARAYEAADRERLVELFGEPERWGSTTGALRWSTIETVVPAFRGATRFSFPVECSYDHEVATTRYFSGVGEGAYPLRLHFNGAVYYEGAGGRLQIVPLPWDRSTRFELPVAVWRETIDSHYPGGGWLRVGEDTLHLLVARKAATGAPTVDECIRGMLERDDAGSERS